ncbi:MAG: 50S ribosomal protein L6 [Planctomycetaceae bacterium]|nr:50S ribosomal protein L6 [Planctomycetaceae bacterium]
MSRIGKKKIMIPSGVKVEQAGTRFKVTGPKGSLEWDCAPEIKVTVENNAIQVENEESADRRRRALHGTTRALLNNMIIGVSQGFEKAMQIYGTGYNVKEQGGKLVLSIGYCHPVELPIPKSVKVEVKTPATRGNDVPALFTLRGYDKQELGQFAAVVRRVRPPEPYQGKGIRYADEKIIRKEGKAFGA